MSFRIQVPRGIVPGSRPAAAIEIAPGAVLAAATPAPGAPPVFASEPLPAGAVNPGQQEANFANAQAVTAAIRAALAAVTPRVRDVTVVVPDASVRVFVLDFDTLPTRADETIAVLRFRLRKSVPFDVELAGLGYQVLSEGSSRLETQWRVLVAVIPGPILAEYESAVRAAGYEPGAVLPASLAALAALSGEEALLVVHHGSGTLTTTIVSGNDVLLHRTMELPLDEAEFGPEIRRTIAVAAAFYEDKLHAPAQTIVYAGSLPATEFAALLVDNGSHVDEQQAWKIIELSNNGLGAVSSLGSRSVAAITGALAETR